MSIAVGRSDIIGIEGDSESSPPYYVRFIDHVVAAIQQQLNPDTYTGGFWPGRSPVAGPGHSPTAWPPAVTSTAGGPRSWNRAVGGYQWSDIAAQISADLAAQPATTVMIFQAGVNDAFHAVSPTTTSNNMKTCLDAVVSAGITKCIVVGPCCIGEKWPTGQNGHDTDLDATIAAMAARVALYAGFVFVDLRATVYAIQEPLLNTPGPGVTDGPLTVLDPVGNAVHFNPTGVYYCAQAVLAQMSIS